MKLLLRSGADPSVRNAQDKTPLDIASEKGHKSCEELVSKLKKILCIKLEYLAYTISKEQIYILSMDSKKKKKKKKKLRHKQYE